MAMTATDRLRFALARWLLKGATSARIPEWVQASFFVPTFRNLVNEGYRANGIVFACIGKLAQAYQTPPMLAYVNDANGLAAPKPDNPLSLLLANPLYDPATGASPMSGPELRALTMLYKAISGNAYWYKVRSRAKRVVQLVPLNDAQLQPVPGGSQLVAYYERQEEGLTAAERQIDPNDVVHFKWLPDPGQPWKGMAPLIPVAREIDTDNEMTRYLFALLKNDAIPRLLLLAPLEGGQIDSKRLQAQWREGHGGDKRGGVAVLEGGLRVERVSLDLQQLAMEALHKVPEARICAALGVPPVIAGINVGLEQMTYNNVGGMRKYFYQDTMVALWDSDAQTATTGLAYEFGGADALTVGFDTSKVVALQEDVATKRTFALEALKARGIKRNEFRAMVGLPPDPDGDIYLEPEAGLPSKRYWLLGGGRKALPMPTDVVISDRDILTAIARWDQAMPDYAGLLEARVEDGQ